ncbi:MAG: AAA family ATPase [Candidatus Spechtbacteria bacterium SB0662_bin_43]|uniref:AAA family ATPase n=1 Tax=Candidatus Spechtbacteria bacterium SB0662_bin_43 TaxID=2604897 RepID=A0A845D9S9_9BACT|nr:AAA family ATPase [Candidatus Spechtbacteria bacterium SB0662_bin_43]
MVIGHRKNREWLEAMREGNAVPHTLLFLGQKGVGKSEFALRCAQWLRQDSVSFEEIIRENSSGFDPDILSFHDLVIADARALRSQISQTPFRGAVRVVLIHAVESINTETANALLKVLEEPTSRTLFILMSTNEKRVLSTIRSRAVSFYFAPVATDSIRAALPTSSIEDIVVWWDHKPSIAQELLADQEKQDSVRRMVRDAALFLQGDLNTRFQLVEQYCSGGLGEDFFHAVLLTARKKGVSRTTYHTLQQGVGIFQKVRTSTVNMPLVLRSFSLRETHRV